MVLHLKEETVHIKDTSLFTKVLRSISLLVLLITIALASKVLFGSSDEAMYIENREIFYTYTFVCTLTYFVTAYWALKRGKTQKL